MQILEATELGTGVETNAEGVEVRLPLAELRKAIDAMEVTPEEYLEAQAKNVVQLLRTNPKNFEAFGMYWFHIKEMIQKRNPDPQAWWMGPYRNDYIYQCAERGSEIFNVLQGIDYYFENWTKNPEQYFVRDGSSWQYSAYDEDYVNRI